MAETLRITQTKSRIGQSPRHRATLDTLGLRGIGKSVTRPHSDSLAAQLRLVAHLVSVESANGAKEQ
jgi:large subunit ribosomal protein L30